MDRSIFISGPDPNLELIYSDVWLPGLYSRRILCFSLPSSSSHAKVIDVLERALDSLVKGTPELGGQSVVVPAAENDSQVPWRALKPYKGIELVVKDLTKSFMSFRELESAGFPLPAFKDEVLLPIAGSIMPEPQPNAKFQLSFIEGGFLLGSCLYHHLTDGNGMNTIMLALSQLCKQAAETTGKLPPHKLDTDRTRLRTLKGTKTDLADHPAYRINPGAWIPGAHHEEETPKADEKPKDDAPAPGFVAKLFRLEHDKAEALKIDGSKSIPVSTHDAINALLWRALVIARYKAGKIDKDATTLFTQPHNARRHLGLSNEWIGNCVYFIIASATVSEVMQEGSLPVLAAKIRTALNNVNTEVVEGLMEVRRADPYGLNWWPVMQSIDKEVVAITSFYHSGLLGTDWGAAMGKVRHFTCTDVGAFATEFRAAHYVGPKLPGGRGCDVGVGLLTDDEPYFEKDELWYHYLTKKR